MTRLNAYAGGSMVIALGIATGACAPTLRSHPQNFEPYGTSLRPAVGVWAGPSVSYSSEGRSGPDLGVSLETPVTSGVILRGQIGRMWADDERLNPLAAHDATLRRVLVDGLMYGPPLLSGTTPYGAIGFGWYDYQYVNQVKAGFHTNGIHASAGLQHV